MKVKTKATNPDLISLIVELKSESFKSKKPIWKAVAKLLDKPTRSRRVVNISRINRNTKEKDVIIVPGKVLASGELDHPVTIAALSFSKQAEEKIKKAGGKLLTIREAMKDKNLKNIKIIG